jgi:hypothetical protein
MTDTTKMSNPPLDELFRNYLTRQTAAHSEGLGFAEVGGEVVPHEAVPLQPVDPQQAWKDALAAATQLAGPARAQWQLPPEWPTLVATQEPAIDLAFCVGNFPQLVRMLQPLLMLGGGVRPTVAAGRPLALPAITDWAMAARTYPEVLLGVGVLRLTRHYDEAHELLKQGGSAPTPWKALRDNEEAALLWHQGRHEDALNSWQGQPESTPVLFNRGMAALFCGDFKLAVESMGRAVLELPEANAWHHLGHMYLALAQAQV